MTLRKSGIGLLRTCKQLNIEATNVLYGVNHFAFTETMHPVVANANLVSPDKRELARRLIHFGDTNDILQMKVSLNLIGASNWAKIRHIKIEIDVHSLFLGYCPLAGNNIGYSAQGRGAGILRDAINIVAGVYGSLLPLSFQGHAIYSNVRV